MSNIQRDADLSERFNVAEEHPEVISKIMEIVEEYEAQLIRGEDQLAPIRDGATVPWE